MEAKGTGLWNGSDPFQESPAQLPQVDPDISLLPLSRRQVYEMPVIQTSESNKVQLPPRERYLEQFFDAARFGVVHHLVTNSLVRGAYCEMPEQMG